MRINQSGWDNGIRIQVLAYAQTHHLTVITIEELVQYRQQHGI